MRKALIVLAILGTTSAPAVAQTAPAAPEAATVAPKPQTVKKKVCERIDAEETTGSRLGSAPVVCKIVEVPVKGGSSNRNLAPAPEQAPQPR